MDKRMKRAKRAMQAIGDGLGKSILLIDEMKTELASMQAARPEQGDEIREDIKEAERVRTILIDAALQIAGTRPEAETLKGLR